MNADVRDTFDRLAAECDELKLRIIPGYRRIQDMALRYAGTPSSILEPGCGTGQSAAMLLERNPGAEYTAIEFSARMRELARARLAAHGDRVRLVDQDLNSSLPSGRFDLVVSLFAIHHVEDKARLFRQVFDRLRSGGRLVFADITIARDPSLERAFLDGWIEFMREAGLGDGVIFGVLEDHRMNDLPEPCERQLEFLRTAGFTPVEVVWSLEKFVLMVASKGETA
jgi:SAM-dependent methyltransferase